MIQNNINWEARGVCFTETGPCHAGVLLEALSRIGAHPDFDRFHYVLADLSACPALNRCQDSLDPLLAQMIGAHYSNPRVTVYVVTNDALLLRLTRLLQRNIPWRIHACDTVWQARQAIEKAS